MFTPVDVPVRKSCAAAHAAFAGLPVSGGSALRIYLRPFTPDRSHFHHARKAWGDARFIDVSNATRGVAVELRGRGQLEAPATQRQL